MAIVRFDPPKDPSKKPFAIARTFLGFAKSPVGTVLSGISQREPAEWKAAYRTLPLELDTETGKVTPITVDKPAGKIQRTVDQRNEDARRAAAAMESAFATGKVPEQLPPGYRATAVQVAQLHFTDAPVAPEETPAQDQPNIPLRDNYMGGFIPPGGIAGFAQMSGASRLALTRGKRGARATGRRRKRRAKAAKPRRVKRAKTRRGKRRLVKGSAAAKRYMASIRRKRRR